MPSVRRCGHVASCGAKLTVFVGHCYLMQDDLQKAYAAYQQALYLLPNPKVRANIFTHEDVSLKPSYRRTQSCGTVSVSCTTAMVRWTMPRKHSPLSFAWTKVSLSDLSYCCIHSSKVLKSC